MSQPENNPIADAMAGLSQLTSGLSGLLAIAKERMPAEEWDKLQKNITPDINRVNAEMEKARKDIEGFTDQILKTNV